VLLLCQPSLVGAQEAPAEEDGCTLEDDPRIVASDVRWEGDSGGMVLAATVPPGFTWELAVQARFGPYRTSWTQGPLEDEDGELQVALAPPPGAFLDPLAEDYVTDLSVRLTGESEDEAPLGLSAPSAFLAWPNGPTAPAVVWDRAKMDEEAPLGVVDDVVRTAATAGVEGIGRVRPPVYLLGTFENEPAPEGD
jgi:hypothetical protein